MKPVQILDQEVLARAGALGKVHAGSLTRTADAVFVATDAGLAQFGGAAGAHGLAELVSRDNSAGQYVYAFGPSDDANQ